METTVKSSGFRGLGVSALCFELVVESLRLAFLFLIDRQRERERERQRFLGRNNSLKTLSFTILAHACYCAYVTLNP